MRVPWFETLVAAGWALTALGCADSAPTSREASAPLFVDSLPVTVDGDHLSAWLVGLDREVRFSTDGAQVGDGGPHLRWEASAPPRPGPCRSQRTDPEQCGRAVEVPIEGGTLWWLARPGQVQWGWTLDRPAEPPREPIELSLELDGVWTPTVTDSRVQFSDATGQRWQVSAPVAWDAEGRGLPVTQRLEGRRLVVSVDADGARWPVTVDPVLTTTASSFSLAGSHMGSLWGGDLNGDGADELVEHAYSLSGGTYTGWMRVHLGGASGPTSAVDHTVTFPQPYYSQTVRRAGDVDQDGYDDLLLGVQGRWAYATVSGSSARLALYSGQSSGLAASPVWSVTALPDAGTGLAMDGDVNGDGFADLASSHGTSSASLLSSGQVDLYFGTSTWPSTTADVTIPGSSANGPVGEPMMGADTNADGYDDLVLGNRSMYPGYPTPRGAVWVLLGSATGPGTTYDLEVQGPAARDNFGTKVVTLGDLDADGFDDLVVSGERHVAGPNTNAGALWVLWGAATGLDPTPTQVLEGDQVGAYVGSQLSAGDADADGYDDLLVSGESYNRTGRAWLFPHAAIASGALALTDAAVTFEPVSGARYLGSSVDLSGDGNGDGFHDALIVTDQAPFPGTVGLVEVFLGYADADGDGVLVGGDATVQDCDDADASVGGPTAWYDDDDGDGLGGSLAASACTAPSGTVSNDEDCDDTDASVGGVTEQYVDSDGDGYGGASTDFFCPADSGWSTVDTDCDDRRASVNPAATELCDTLHIDPDCDGVTDDDDSSTDPSSMTTYYRDSDGDSYGDPGATDQSCLPQSGYVANDEDCDDSDASIRPYISEKCDALDVDENCNGLSDDDDPVVDNSTHNTFFADTDGDSFGDASSTVAQCDVPTGYVSDNTDCDDSRADVFPGGTEVCDAADADEDCDGAADDADASVDTGTYDIFFADTDGDGFGNAGSFRRSCDAGSGYVSDNTDCDDTRATSYPGGTEVCDADDADEDCNGLADDDDPGADWSSRTTWYRDDDGDGYGDPDGSTMATCEPVTGMVDDATDCDDTNPAVSPAATELCDDDDVDEDCDGLSDDADDSVDPTTRTRSYADRDGDRHGDPAMPLDSCEVPPGYVLGPTDCDDTRADRNPHEQEVCDDDDVDEDCDGLSDDADDSVDPTSQATWYADTDADGYGDPGASVSACSQPEAHLPDASDCDDTDPTRFPGAPEPDCDGVDHDCDGQARAPEDCLDDSGTPQETVSDVDGEGAGPAKSGCSAAGAAGAAGLLAWVPAGLALVGRRRRSPEVERWR